MKDRLEASFIAAQLEIMREIGDVADDRQQAEDVFANVLTIATADGEICESEYKVLESIANALNLRIEDWI